MERQRSLPTVLCHHSSLLASRASHSPDPSISYLTPEVLGQLCKVDLPNLRDLVLFWPLKDNLVTAVPQAALLMVFLSIRHIKLQDLVFPTVDNVGYFFQHCTPVLNSLALLQIRTEPLASTLTAYSSPRRRLKIKVLNFDSIMLSGGNWLLHDSLPFDLSTLEELDLGGALSPSWLKILEQNSLSLRKLRIYAQDIINPKYTKNPIPATFIVQLPVLADLTIGSLGEELEDVETLLEGLPATNSLTQLTIDIMTQPCEERLRPLGESVAVYGSGIDPRGNDGTGAHGIRRPASALLSFFRLDFVSELMPCKMSCLPLRQLGKADAGLGDTPGMEDLVGLKVLSKKPRCKLEATLLLKPPTTMPIELPPRFTELKRAIAATNPNFEQDLTKAWKEVLAELDTVTKTIAKKARLQSTTAPTAAMQSQPGGSEKNSAIILTWTATNRIMREGVRSSWDHSLIRFHPYKGATECGCTLIWEFDATSTITAAKNGSAYIPQVSFVELDQLSEAQIADIKRQHLSATCTASGSATWASRGAIECWEDENFRVCFADILSEDWSKHDPYTLEPHLEAQTSLYRRTVEPVKYIPDISGMARHQLSLNSKAGPGPGTLKVFPDVLLSNAYIILCPFFHPLVPLRFKEILDAEKWEFVNPGNTVFWHCNVVHSVEQEHTGTEDSAVMYIPVVSLTPANAHYVEQQKEHFLNGVPPPDFLVVVTGVGLMGLASDKDMEELRMCTGCGSCGGHGGYGSKGYGYGAGFFKPANTVDPYCGLRGRAPHRTCIYNGLQFVMNWWPGLIILPVHRVDINSPFESHLTVRAIRVQVPGMEQDLNDCLLSG
ncbi:hypothetical protein DFH08DRAFT_818516 [Mycena albidolilacea]|uniref:Uncharacterized protein n=1 Tax=Mycena albidolilacea TaxID=1033008 RepID=A0AAD7EG39_9AGAR|nr:hypothetical protein DFH08DRAFT_818516 [Mycena albidolilacea]